MVEIVRGEYKVEDLAPGKKRVYVNITDQTQSAAGDATTSRSESNSERLTEGKKRQSRSKQSAPVKIEGNNKIVSIVSGSQQVDIPLGKK
jgi:hypothetical protein